MNSDLFLRHEKGLEIVRDAATTAERYFRNMGGLVVDNQGKQDLVSDAERNIETQIRESLQSTFPQDGITGEKYGHIQSSSGYTWVIDPIDGRASFVAGMPGWCVVLACVNDGVVMLGMVIDPIAKEIYLSVKGRGASLNGNALSVSTSSSLADGSTAVGYSTRTSIQDNLDVLGGIMKAGGSYYRCGSGALMLCYVAAGRLIGFCEPHMYAWDCLAALHIIEEAGGMVKAFDMPHMLEQGGRVVAACPGVYPQLLDICDKAYV